MDRDQRVRFYLAGCALSGGGGGETSMRQSKGMDEGRLDSNWVCVYWFAEWSRGQMRFAAAGSTTCSTYCTLLWVPRR